MGTRVYKAQIDAIVEALPVAKIALGVTNNVQAFAAILAEAVAGAMDSKARYIIVSRIEGYRIMAYGPYATRGMAERALTRHPLPLEPISTPYIVPLYVHPIKEGEEIVND